MEFRKVIKTWYCYVLRHSSVTSTPEQRLQRASRGQAEEEVQHGNLYVPSPWLWLPEHRLVDGTGTGVDSIIKETRSFDPSVCHFSTSPSLMPQISTILSLNKMYAATLKSRYFTDALHHPFPDA